MTCTESRRQITANKTVGAADKLLAYTHSFL